MKNRVIMGDSLMDNYLRRKDRQDIEEIDDEELLEEE